MRYILVLTLLFAANVYGQITIDGFLNESSDKTIASVKQQHQDKKIEESDVMIYTGLTYYDWMDPISVRVAYLFGKDGKQQGKVLGNGNGTEGDAKTFFTMAKIALVKKYGTDYKESSMMGMTTLAWNPGNGSSINLTQRKLRTTITIFSK
jgi:hypothetical protein